VGPSIINDKPAQRGQRIFVRSSVAFRDQLERRDEKRKKQRIAPALYVFWVASEHVVVRRLSSYSVANVCCVKEMVALGSQVPAVRRVAPKHRFVFRRRQKKTYGSTAKRALNSRV